MLWMLFGGSTFLFIALTLGFALHKKMYAGNQISFPLFSILLTGTAAITVYCNVLSFFVPLNFWVLVPLLLLSLAIVYTPSFYAEIKNKVGSISSLLFTGTNKWITLAGTMVVVLFALVPPYNTDSSGYHILAILWNESYKIVPGLANLFPQFGFNSAFMVLSAPFSFSDLAGQAIYPINPVLVLSFFLWMLHKSYLYMDYRKPIIWLMLFILFRQFPINIASPSADALASMLVFYCFFTLLETREKWLRHQWIPMLALALFAVTVKISTIPLLLLFIIPFTRYKNEKKKIINAYLMMTAIAVIIFVPWLVRNVMLSGYLVFPVPLTGFLNVDWKVPVDIALQEKLHVSNAPRLVSDDWEFVNSLPFTQWFPVWLQALWIDNKFNALLTYFTFLSPLYGVYILANNKSSKPYVAAYFIATAGLIFWLIGSPDVRFGYHYMLPILFFPLLLVASKKSLNISGSLLKGFTLVTLLMCGYYAVIAIKMLSPFSPKQYALQPLRSAEYLTNNELSSFNFVMLNDTTKLYFHDRSHHSLNAPLPSSDKFRKGISMRGATLQEGFRITNDSMHVR